MKKSKYLLWLILLNFVLLGCMIGAIMVGSVGITPSIILEALLYKLGILEQTNATNAQQVIILEIRAPRVLLAAIVGASLAICGAAIQALVKNSIADPYILGVSSGASVGATSVILLGTFSFLGMYALSVAAFLGAISAVLIVFFSSSSWWKIINDSSFVIWDCSVYGTRCCNKFYAYDV